MGSQDRGLVMSPVRDARQEVPELAGRTAFEQLVDEKAWEHLGLTGEEFRRRWYAGEYKLDLRQPVRLLDHLMRSGHWGLPGCDTSSPAPRTRPEASGG